MPAEEITKGKNKEQSKVIDWSKVLTNAISLLVATVFVGAAAILWNQGDKIKTEVADTTDGLQATQHELSHEIAHLTVALDTLRKQLEQFAESLPDNVQPDLPDPRATDKKWFAVPKLGSQKIESERERIIRDIQKHQRAINPRQRIAPE